MCNYIEESEAWQSRKNRLKLGRSSHFHNGIRTMSDYLTAMAYQRWYRQYMLNLGIFIKQLDNIKIRTDALPLSEDRQHIEKRIEEIDEHLEKTVPRNFFDNGQSLTQGEECLENCEVLINLIRKLFKKPAYFLGIYHAEKERIQKVHHEFKFKEKLKESYHKLVEAEEKYSEEEIPLQQQSAA